jgi:hypothetical protein
MRSAALRLRGRDGPLHGEITWPDAEPEALVVILAEGAEAADSPPAVTLRVQCATHHDERTVIEWTEDHAQELGVPAGRVIVVR